MRYLHKNELVNWLKLLNFTKKEGGLKDCKFALVFLFLNCYNRHILMKNLRLSLIRERKKDKHEKMGVLVYGRQRWYA